MSVITNKLIDLGRLSKFKELMDGSVDSKLAALKVKISQITSSVPTVDTAEEGVLYWVPAKGDGEYEIWAKENVDGIPTMVKNSSISISGDLDGLLTKDEAKATYFNGVTVTDATVTLSRPDGSTVPVTVDNVASAGKATNDGNGNSIVDTYETKADAKAHADTAEATYQKAADITLAEDADITAFFATSAQAYEGKSYSFITDFSLSDPASMITYADDSGAAAMSTDWFDILGLKLCVLKDGKVLYYLNPDNVAQQIDGSAADITTLGNDVMLEIPRMGTNCMWLDSDRLKITITTAPNSAEYDYRAFSLHKYNDCDKIYIGRYHACLDNNRLYSSSGKTPMVWETLADCRTYATNRGTGYTDIGICDDILLQCLYLLIVRNFDSQSAVGRGICSADWQHDTGEANTFGWLNTGSPDKTDGYTAVCCLGIENFWGNIYAWGDGIIRNGDRQWFMAQYADQYNSDATGYEYIAQASPTKSGYQGRCAGIPKFIFMPDASTVAADGRSESTYMCDYQYINESGTVNVAFGGAFSDGSWVGAFNRYLIGPVSISDGAIGSRLVYKKVAEN